MQLKDLLGRDLLKELGFDHVPTDIIEKRVTDLLDLKGKKAVVTGAGGPGLGQACANRLAGCGADVALIDLNLAGAERNAEEVRKRWGTRAIPLQGNAADWDDVRRFMRESHDKLGGIDILVNNAVMTDARPFETQTKEQIDLSVAGTLLMPLYCSRAVLDYMIPQRSGRIINISSVGGRIAHRNLVVYNACKSAVIGFTRNLAHEVARYGIYVLGVAPGHHVARGAPGAVTQPHRGEPCLGVHPGGLLVRPARARVATRRGGEYGGLPRLGRRKLHVWRVRQRRRWTGDDGVGTDEVANTLVRTPSRWPPSARGGASQVTSPGRAPEAARSRPGSPLDCL